MIEASRYLTIARNFDY